MANGSSAWTWENIKSVGSLLALIAAAILFVASHVYNGDIHNTRAEKDKITDERIELYLEPIKHDIKHINEHMATLKDCLSILARREANAEE